MKKLVLLTTLGFLASWQAQEPPLPTPQPTLAQCSKDLDCKGDRICEGGKCTTPTQTSVTSNPILAPSKPTNPSPEKKTRSMLELVITDLASKESLNNCYPPLNDFNLDGIVKKRNYLDDGTTLSEVVVEEADGQRYTVHIDNDHVQGLSSFAATEVSQALTLNRNVKIRMLGCGASGDWIVAREIRAF